MMNNDTVLLLEKLASEIGSTSEYLWGALIKQAQLNSIKLLIAYCLVIPLLIHLHRKFWKWYRNDKNESVLADGDLIFVFYFVSVAALGMAFVCGLNRMITGFLNPEYLALQELLHVIR